jgi:tetratricopeptide (TPR) repeat protein
MKPFVLLLLLIGSPAVFSQKVKADSLKNLLSREKADSSKVRILWQLADAMNRFKPDTALIIAQEAVYLAQNIKYAEGESRSLGILASSFLKMGNYPKALDYYFRKLKIEETRKNYRALASVTMNIGITYASQGEYDLAIDYYNRADSIIQKYDVEDFKGSIVVNKGDLYFKTGKADSAKYYFNKGLEWGLLKANYTVTGASKLGLANSFVKEAQYVKADAYYRESVVELQKVNNEELICESFIGMAEMFEKTGSKDSAVLYAKKAYTLAKKDDFLSKEYDAVYFLSKHYKGVNIDSAYAYLSVSLEIKELLQGADKIRETLILSTNEQLRQAEIVLEKNRSKKLRKQQLQLLFIGIFIPFVFLATFLISRKKASVKLVKLMGIISLLIFFEYLTLLLHPFVSDLTNHTPVYEILIFVMLAAFLIPAHHRMEHWFIQRITNRLHHPVEPHENKDIQMIKNMVHHVKNKRRPKKPPHK